MANINVKRKAQWEAIMRGSVYDASMKVLDEFGFKGLTMERVAKEADVSTGTLYNYFSNKEEIIKHVIETAFEPLKAELESIMQSGMQPVEKLRSIICTVLNAIEEKRTLLEIIRAAEVASEEIRALRQSKHVFFEDLIASVVREGVASGDFIYDAELGGVLVFCLLDGLVGWKLDTGRRLGDIAGESEACLSLALKGLMSEFPVCNKPE
ncbi:MAG: TetR/AcrR family transcriptional regulator [Candidatus Coatesbacteria bacterium]|nr:TetR/AcrR family transcriptional regulator [Candidatus Coatesbacteria bacterium]